MPEISDNPAQSRFEMNVDGTLAIVEYKQGAEGLVLTHTEVPEALSGRGIGSRLARSVLDTLRDRGEKVVPRCDFIASYIERHPEYRELVAGG